MVLCKKTENQVTRRRVGTVAVLTALAICAAVVWGQDEAVLPAEPVIAEATVAEAPAETTPAEADVAVGEQAYETGLDGQSIQTISFRRDMPVRDALRMLAQMYQKNIVPSAKVDGIVTVSHLYDVTFEEALEAILGTHKYEIRGNFIRVYTNEEFMQDKSRFEYVTIPLYYINATEASNLAIPLLSEFGQLGATSPAEQHTMPGRGGDSLALHDRLVVSDYPENIEKIREVLAEVDVEPAQVLIEVTVMKAELNEDIDFGIDWRNVPGVGIEQSGVAQSGFGLAGTTGLTAGISIDSFSAAIRALEVVKDTTVLANPKIMALNKQAGKLIIGRQDGYETLRNISGVQDSTVQTQEIEFLESGTVLEFRPFIGRDGMIRMEIRPEQSDGEILDGRLPRKTTTEVITNVMVKDGQTIVLGGLFQEETQLERDQVPLLGDIPFLGEMFKGTSDKSKRTELIVLITPHIIHTPEQADGANRLEDVYRLAYNARKDIHGLSRARMAEGRYRRAVREYNAGNYEAALMELNGPYDISPRNDLDAIRLRERIFRAKNPGMWDTLERVMLQDLEQDESGKWLRR